ncbi:MAG: hypothetical protein ABGX12_02410, partial [Desulfurobacteriaceae bacterium]
GCCEFGREDELFPFEEKARRFIEGLVPDWRTGRNYSIPSRRKEIEKRLLKIKNTFLGSEEEGKLDYLLNLNRRANLTPAYLYILESYLFPFLERLAFYRANAPEGFDSLKSMAEEIVGEFGFRRKFPDNVLIEVAIDSLISALYCCGGEDD